MGDAEKTAPGEEVEGLTNGKLAAAEQADTAMVPEDEVAEMEYNDRDRECGWYGCRPDWLQCCANMKVFTLVLSMINVFGSMNFSYYTAVITQIEKQFGLSSAMTGFVKNVDNIGYMLTVLLFSHFCRYSNKPKVFSVATLVTGIAIFIFALPHFIYGSAVNIEVLVNGTETSNSSTINYELCDGVDESDDTGCSSRSYLAPFNMGALAIFVMSEMLQGIAQSPKFTLSITYMDDNAKDNSPLYYGFMFGMRAFAPVLGFMLGAWCTSIYVDLSDTALDPKDPRWVGAWWLGFVVCAICSVVWVLPLSLFPPVLSNKDKSGYRKPGTGSSAGDLKDLPKALWRLISNPILLCNILGACFNIFLVGFTTFTPKYLEMHFGMTAARASIMTGVMAATSYAIGPIVSGRIVSRLHITPTRALGLVVIIHIISTTGFSILMFLGCPGGDWAGDISLDSSNILDAVCNTNCSCDPFVFSPVCGSDGINYFSPCYAGCQEWGLQENATDQVFFGCGCVGGGGIAHVGECSKDCRHMLIPYLVIMGVTQFASSMSSVPIMSTIMRSVQDKDKALSLALFGFVIMVISFPAPMFFGYVIDKACLVTQTSCTRQGACLLYEADTFRYLLHGMAVLLKACALVVFVSAFLWSRNRDRRLTAQKCLDEGKEMMVREVNARAAPAGASESGGGN